MASLSLLHPTLNSAPHSSITSRHLPKSRLNWIGLGVCTLGLATLCTFAWRTRQDQVAFSSATPQGACYLLVQALTREDTAQIERLTTARGRAALQKIKSAKRFTTYPQLAKRLTAEWGRPTFWQGAAVNGPSATFEVRRIAKPGEPIPRLRLIRTGKVWQLDDYVPGPDRLLKPLERLGPTWPLSDAS